MTCEEFEDLAGAYTLDDVTPAERQAAAAHLASCAKCRSLLHNLSGAVELLPFAVSPTKTPKSLAKCLHASAMK